MPLGCDRRCLPRRSCLARSRGQCQLKRTIFQKPCVRFRPDPDVHRMLGCPSLSPRRFVRFQLVARRVGRVVASHQFAGAPASVRLPGRDDFPRRWRAIKDLFSRRLKPGETLSRSRAAQGERGIWQRWYWEHAIRDERDFGVHVDYVHFNPVRHGFVSRAVDWPYSTFRACVAAGLYPPDWIGSDDGGADRGERSPA